MEPIFVIAFLLIPILAIALCIAISIKIEEDRRYKKANCVVYIMRVADDGRVELKRSPEQLWNWKF